MWSKFTGVLGWGLQMQVRFAAGAKDVMQISARGSVCGEDCQKILSRHAAEIVAGPEVCEQN